ncbi:hypothetical protein [Candidatus Palauibacter sp.]|uniref:hypothetical protein n=1 Tax=Candidatus Palauibacter sp. TaxID=3101350 RepID=UPI003B52744A
MGKWTDDGKRYIPTVQEIEEGRSARGGYTRATPGYLVRIRGRIAHIWTGSDAACRQYSTGGIKNPHRYTVTDTVDGRQVCKNCRGAVSLRGKAFGGLDVDDPRQVGLWDPN